MGSSRSRRASSMVTGAQTMPEVWRMMKAIFSVVHSEAATIRSPSPSRSSSSVTTTISPLAKACKTSGIGWAMYVLALLEHLAGVRTARQPLPLPALLRAEVKKLRQHLAALAQAGVDLAALVVQQTLVGRLDHGEQ